MDPEYERVIAMRESQPQYWIVEPMVTGEEVQRSYGINYKRYAETKPPRNFSLIPEMLDLLSSNTTEYSGWAADHLREAQKEYLPEEVRTEHYDIAGAWMVAPNHNFDHPAFRLWVKGNGA